MPTLDNIGILRDIELTRLPKIKLVELLISFFPTHVRYGKYT